MSTFISGISRRPLTATPTTTTAAAICAITSTSIVVSTAAISATCTAALFMNRMS